MKFHRVLYLLPFYFSCVISLRKLLESIKFLLCWWYSDLFIYPLSLNYFSFYLQVILFKLQRFIKISFKRHLKDQQDKCRPTCLLLRLLATAFNRLVINFGLNKTSNKNLLFLRPEQRIFYQPVSKVLSQSK